MESILFDFKGLKKKKDSYILEHRYCLPNEGVSPFLHPTHIK